MTGVRRDREFFIPAATPQEAINRVFSLTGAERRNRGEKRALVALRDALGLDVDITKTNAVTAERIADALDIEWRPEEFTIKNKVNLDGLNALLEGAADAYYEGQLVRLQGSTPATLSGPGWASFQPAVSKIEAVTRIARLTGAPQERLGPGSKEHKSVLVNLADRMFGDAALDRSSKTRMARDIAEELAVTWTDMCYSTGETISLEGLNTILAGAERRLGRLGSTSAEALATPQSEGEALLAALHDGWNGDPWDGRECVEWLAASGARGQHDNEWQGWYFEARGRELLNAAFTPGMTPVRTSYGNTTFDYALNRVWDLKAHTSSQFYPDSGTRASRGGVLILNDERAVRSCVAEQGLGFLVLSGEGVMDEDGDFLAWHRRRKERAGKRVSASNSGVSRVRKSRFAPLQLEAFWIEDTQALERALLAGQLAVRPIGRQPPRSPELEGAARADKFQLNMARASALRTASMVWHVGD